MTDTTLSDPRTWVDQHGGFLFRFAMLRLHSPDSAEEAVQELLKKKFTAKIIVASENGKQDIKNPEALKGVTIIATKDIFSHIS